MKISFRYLLSFQTRVACGGNQLVNRTRFILMKYKTGQVVLFNNSNSIFTKLITFYNKTTYGFSKCTHTGIIAQVEKDRVLIFEPVDIQDGFESYWYEKNWLDEKKKEGKILFVKPNNYVKNIKQICEKYEGIKYGVLDIFSIALFWATGLKLKTTGSKRLICSEAVVRVLYEASDKKIDFEKEFNKPYDLITPMDIFLSQQVSLI